MINLPFSWDELPRVSLGLDGHRTRVQTEDWKIQLDSGREVMLDSLHQFKTYAGVLCGLPTHTYYHEQQIVSVMEKAKRIFRCEERPPWILAPRMQRATVVNRGVDEIERRTGHRPPEQMVVDFLPPVGSIGLFSSPTPARNPDEVSSSMLVIWFQDMFGLPDARAGEQLHELPWEERAWDWTS